MLRKAIPAAAITLAAAVVVLAWHPWRHSGADRVRHLVPSATWSGCARVTTTSGRAARRWPHAVESVTVDCEMLGPWLGYARFATAAALRADLTARPPGQSVCLRHGTEVLVNGLEPGDFAPDCARLHGALVDGISGRHIKVHVPADEQLTDANLRLDERLHQRAEGAALRAYFARMTELAG